MFVTFQRHALGTNFGVYSSMLSLKHYITCFALHVVAHAGAVNQVALGVDFAGHIVDVVVAAPLGVEASTILLADGGDSQRA